DEVAQRFPEQLAAWSGSETVPAPDGESRAMLAARVQQARDRVLERYSGRVPVVVTHSMPIKTLVCLALGAPLTASVHVQPAPGSLTELRTYADGTAVLTGLGLRP
ncbi:MAG: histidine phosphatase family protein, partial [Jiangellaceae bacterium]